jgi:hypothetical protein
LPTEQVSAAGTSIAPGGVELVGVPGADQEIPYPGLPEISREELRRRLRDASLIVLDVHSPRAFAQEHLPRAINLPVAEIETRAPEVLPDRNSEIAVYCTKFT